MGIPCILDEYNMFCCVLRETDCDDGLKVNFLYLKTKFSNRIKFSWAVLLETEVPNFNNKYLCIMLTK